AAALSPSSFRKRYRSSYETSSSSPTLPVWKRYRDTFELILDTDSEKDELREEGTEEDESDEDHGLNDGSQGLEDEGLGLEEEEAVLEVEEDQIPEDERVYIDILAYAPPVAPVQTLPSPKWLSELYGSILYDHTQRLDALPPTLFADIGRDVRELYSRSRAVRDEIFSLVLALEAWVGRVDTQLEDMSQDRYDDHILIHDMLVQQAAMQRKLQEMRGRVTTLEQERDRRE
ncbi:hypothetical protein Tco_1223949, partial [Tanacetum coccineum]